MILALSTTAAPLCAPRHVSMWVPSPTTTGLWVRPPQAGAAWLAGVAARILQSQH